MSGERSSLDGMFYPSSIAVVGASNKEGKIGNSIMKSLDREYGGDIYPINLDEKKILDYEAFSSLLEIDSDVDLAVIAVPAPVVPDVVKECGEAGIKNIIIVSAGFRESGKADLEEQIKEHDDRYDLNIIGPNCLGILNPEVGLDTIFNPPEKQARPGPGSIAFLSQSGATGAAIMDWFSEEDIGISKFVSYGNRVDVDEADLLDYLSEDPETDFIAYYIEGVKDGRRFLEAAKKCDKPIMVLKSGRTKAGASAASSHTASLAGKDAVYEGAFKEAEILRVSTLRELFNISKAISRQPLAEGEDIAIVTNGGGVGVMAADSLMDIGLDLADFTEETAQRFEAAVEEGKIPSTASLENPVDIVGDADPARYEEALKIVVEDDNVDSILVVLLFQSPMLGQGAIDVVDSMQGYDKPVIAVAPGGVHSDHLADELEERGIPVYQTSEEGVEALCGLTYCGVR